jgi:hypothetical protein
LEDREEAIKASTYERAVIFERAFCIDATTARMMALCVAQKPMILLDWWSPSI